MNLEQEKAYPVDEGQRLGFMEHLGRFDSDESFQIMSAYDLAEKVHEKQDRASGERYFSHPRSVALILVYMGTDDADLISGSLLHDVIEDAKLINGEKFITNTAWMERADAWMEEKNINPRVKEIVSSLTKPRIDHVDVHGEEQRRNLAIEKLRKASPEALLVKMADRLHNLKTLTGLDEWKAGMVISETQGVMYSVFTKVLDNYPREGRALFKQMREAICEYERIRNR